MCVIERERGRTGDMFWRSRTRKKKRKKKSEDRYRGRCMRVEEKKQEKKNTYG